MEHGNERIQDYGFGRIVIDGEKFTSDVIVYPDRVDASWWRKEGHRLVPEDLPFLQENPPQILVIGQGRFGMMKIDPRFREWVEQLGIEFYATRSAEAVKMYNRFWKEGQRNIIGAFHLTC